MFIKKKFKRIPRTGAIKLIKEILYQNPNIHITKITKKWKGFHHYNRTKFDDKHNLKPEVIKDLRTSLNGFLHEIGKEIPQYDEVTHKHFEVISIDGIDCYVLNKNISFKKVRKLTCDEGGDVVFKYNFLKPDTDIIIPSNKDIIQRCLIQILSTPIKFDYPIENEYFCPQCESTTKKKSYETASTNSKLLCPGIFNYLDGEGNSKSRLCKLSLYPDNEISLTKDAYYYDLCYDDEKGGKHTAGSFSFEKFEPGFYECVLFKVKNPRKTELFQLMDIKPILSNTFVLPEKELNINYLITLQKSVDKYIKEQTGMEIYGLYPIKISLIIQTMMSHLKLKLIANIQIVGDPSTGKSTVLKYYGFLLNNHLNLSTNGLSISIPGLRGTKQVITLMGKDQKIITPGYLGTFRSIHIDEAGENKDLVQNLKTFLLEDNYGYDKAGATGVSNVRLAQINLSENLDYNHLGQYRGAIRKAYKDFSAQIGEEEKPDWDEKWDLHSPLFSYENPYLYKVISEKRTEHRLKQMFWIDGYDYALHERFPFYFYLVNEIEDEKFIEIVKGNVSRDTISENLQLIRALKTDDIPKFFESLKEYKSSDTDIENFSKVDKILGEYGIIADARMKTFYYNLVKVSRIANKRCDINKEDYDLLKWMLEKTNSKLEVINTVNYKVTGAPDIEGQRRRELEIEDSVKVNEGQFGLPEGEF